MEDEAIVDLGVGTQVGNDTSIMTVIRKESPHRRLTKFEADISEYFWQRVKPQIIRGIIACSSVVTKVRMTFATASRV